MKHGAFLAAFVGVALTTTAYAAPPKPYVYVIVGTVRGAHALSANVLGPFTEEGCSRANFNWRSNNGAAGYTQVTAGCISLTIMADPKLPGDPT